MVALPPQWRDGRSRHNRRATHFSDKLGAALGTILAVIVIVCLLIATCRSNKEEKRAQDSPPTGRPPGTSGHGRKVKRSPARPRSSKNNPRTRQDINRKPGKKFHGRTGQGRNGPSRLLNNPGPGRLLSVPLEALQDDTTRTTRQVNTHQTVHTNPVGVSRKTSGQVRFALSSVAQPPDIAITAPAQLRLSVTQTAIDLDPLPPGKPAPIKPHFELKETPVTSKDKGKGRKNGNRPAPAIRTGESSSSNQATENRPTFNLPTVNHHPLTESRPPTQSLPNDTSRNELPRTGFPRNNLSNAVPTIDPASINPPSTNTSSIHPDPVYLAPTNIPSTNLTSTNPLSLHTVPLNPAPNYSAEIDPQSTNSLSTIPISTDQPQLNTPLNNPLPTNLPTLHPSPPPYPGAHLVRTPPTPQSSILQTPNTQPVYPSAFSPGSMNTAQTVLPPGNTHPAQTAYPPTHTQPVQAGHPPQELADHEEEDRFLLETPQLKPSSRKLRTTRRGGKR